MILLNLLVLHVFTYFHIFWFHLFIDDWLFVFVDLVIFFIHVSVDSISLFFIYLCQCILLVYFMQSILCRFLMFVYITCLRLHLSIFWNYVSYLLFVCVLVVFYLVAFLFRYCFVRLLSWFLVLSLFNLWTLSFTIGATSFNYVFI